MDRNDRISTDGHPENTNRELHMQPGRLDDIESPEAYATRSGQGDVTGQTPGRSSEGERLHDGEDMTNREGMAGQGGGNPAERGERQAQTGGAGRVSEGEDIGGGQRARPASGLHGADGRVREGEDVGHGVQAHAADGAYTANGHVERGEDIGGGIRARRADEQDPGNPLV